MTEIKAERQPLVPQLAKVDSPMSQRRAILAITMIFIGAAVMIGGILLLGVEYWQNFPHSP